jgi:F-type H+-transporting ATPase subunit b
MNRRNEDSVRTRIRSVLAVLGIVVAMLAFATPAFAAEEEGEPEFANHAAEECVHLLEAGGTIDDCQEAPSPLLPELTEVIWGSLAFAVLLLAMWKWGVPAVKNMEQAREDRIRNDLESAERARTEAEGEKAQYLAQIADARNEAATIIEEARQSAEAVRTDLIARAEQEANEIRQRAQADIANQRAQALAQLRDEVTQLSIDLAGRIVERNLDDATNRELVNSFIDQVGRSN